MVQNFPGPYELRLTMTALAASDPLRHTQRLNLQLTATPSPGDAFNNINAVTRGGTATPDLAAAVEAWLTLIAPRFATLTVFGAVELWKYQPLTFEANFISAYNPTKVAGNNANPTVKSNQEIYTFRTLEGGIMRINLLETVRAVGLVQPYPTANTSADAIFDFITGSTNWILARDTSYPFASMNFLPGQNEKSFRQRFR